MFLLLCNNKLTRDGDPIHLGKKGLSLYVQVIKKSIFIREQTERGSHVSSSMTYRDALTTKPP